MIINKNRGFTLVELAIVLVVIGMILGMAIKGKSLLDSATLKAEVAKVQRIETAANLYYARYSNYNISKAPNNWLEGGINFSDFVDEGMLKMSDIDSPLTTGPFYPGSQYENHSFALKTCGYLKVGNELYFAQPYNASVITPHQVCIFFRPFETFACAIENILDDDNASTGKARYTENTIDNVGDIIFVEQMNAMMDDCTAKAKKLGLPATHLHGGIYAYKLNNF